MSTAFKGRYEDHRLVTGQGRYTSDWNLPGQSFAVFVRADRAHAEIAGIDTAAARNGRGVLGVFTGDDLVAAGFKSPRAMAFFKGKDGTTLKDPPRPALAHGKVRFVGEPVALVVAESENAAQDAAEAIAIDYRDLPVATEPQDAIAKGAPVLHESVPDNLALDYEYGNKAAADEGFAKAKHVARVSLHAQRLAGAPMEPKSGLAAFDAKSGMFDLYMPTQGMAGIRTDLSHITGLPIEKFRIHAKDVGGGFGVRNEVYPEFAALAFAAQKIGRPVKWTGTRSESMVSDHHARGVHLSGELALDDDGQFPRHAGRMAGQCRRLLLERRPVHQYRRGANLDAVRRLPHAGALWLEPADLHQHHTDRALSRRRPSECVISGGAAGRRGRPRQRHRPRQAQAAQSPAQERVPLQDADRLDL